MSYNTPPNDWFKDEPILNSDDLSIIPYSELKWRGVCSDHLNSANDFIKNGIRQIMTKTFVIEKKIINKRESTEEDKKIQSIFIKINTTNITLKPPTNTHYASSREDFLTPKTALLEDKTYASKLYVDIEIKAIAYMKDGSQQERSDILKNVLICNVPIVVKGNMCNIANKSKNTLLNMEEDPNDPGGYFIIKGIEWVINSIESSTFNNIKIFNNVGHKNHLARLEILSKHGDSYENSGELSIALLTNGQIVCTINRAPFSQIQIPFYILFRILGWCSDKKICEWILHSLKPKDVVRNFLMKRLDVAFKTKYNNFGDVSNSFTHDDIIRILISKMPETYGYIDFSNQSSVQYVFENVLTKIDQYLLPHVGNNNLFRHEKALVLTQLIRKLLLVNMGVIKATDRDSYQIKRMHSAGVSLAKAFKQHYNFAFVHPLKRQFAKDFKNNTFSRVDLVQSAKNAINPADFERALAQAITTGTKTQIRLKGGARMTNRLTSQMLHRKNQLTFISTMRQINSMSSNQSKSKQSARAKEMREVHSSGLGYICPVQTTDGENVGINKQMAISAHITSGSSSIVLKSKLLRDPDIIPLNKVTPENLRDGYSQVKVNGHWIGCTKHSYILIEKYRMLRRQKAINKYTTIYWKKETDEVMFWVDVGRMLRPLLIVYNNYTDDKGLEIKNDEKFVQWIKLTREMIEGLKNKKINIMDLVEQNVIEYISPSEQENLYLAPSFDELWENKNNTLKRYTHCDIPVSLLGFAALICPLGQHNPPGRTLLSTNQVKQACGWFSLTWPYRIDKSGFLQYNCEIPLVKTISNDFLLPNGQNCIVAVQIYSGYNMEDSLIMNQGAVDRGLFGGVHFTFEKSELEKNERFGNPDPASTFQLKSYADYSKIHDGFPKKGTLIKKNDVIIGKYTKYDKDDGKYEYIDRSVVYKHNEDAIVFNVIVSRNQEGKPFAKVQLMINHEPQIGDKFAQRNGQKGVLGNILKESNMPFTSSGMVPDIIFNPHSFPSRMTISSLMELLMGKIAANKAQLRDCTIFKKNNIESMIEELKQLGLNPYGRERLYCGINGKFIDTEIFIGPIYYQRIQKFASSQIYAVSHGSTDAITRQPLDGKSSHGGLRLGEMEKDVIIANGLCSFLSEKFFDHSDGFKIYACRGCGKFAIVNKRRNIYQCRQCKDNAFIAEIDSSWSAKLFIQELNSMNIGTQMKMKPYEFFEYE